MASSYPEPGTAYSGPLTEALSKTAVERTIAIPFRFDTDGYVAVAEGRGNIIRQEILTLILTFLGERLMLPGYGSNLASYVYEAQDPRTISIALNGIRELVLNNFTDVTILYLNSSGAIDEGELEIQLDYTYQLQPFTLAVNVSSIFQETTP